MGKAVTSWPIEPDQHKVLQRGSAAASWARALWAKQGLCKQLGQPEWASHKLSFKIEPISQAGTSCSCAFGSILSIPQHCFVAKQLNSALFCRKMLKYGTFCHETLKFVLWAKKCHKLRCELTPHFMLLCNRLYHISCVMILLQTNWVIWIFPNWSLY